MYSQKLKSKYYLLPLYFHHLLSVLHIIQRSFIYLRWFIINSFMDIAKPFLTEKIGTMKHFYCSWGDQVMASVGPMNTKVSLTGLFLFPSTFFHVFPSCSQLIVKQPLKLDTMIMVGGVVSEFNYKQEKRTLCLLDENKNSQMGIVPCLDHQILYFLNVSMEATLKLWCLLMASFMYYYS